MRFLKLSLMNYIGIYNGMGLREITIDFSLCRYRITVIRGDNGSGKSTLMKALSVFPDPNTQFIPGVPASKEVVIENGNIVYNIRFIHGVNQRGDREVTKAHIYRNGEDLNPNGNVKSYRDIIFEELNLDPNFESLSRLSSDDRGLADKKPAERKKFVNSILSSLQSYNDIYKLISKKASTTRSMISSVSNKLSNLGDKMVQSRNLEDIEDHINKLQDDKDAATINFTRKQFEITSLDPDGSIQREYDSLKLDKVAIAKSLGKSHAKYVDIVRSFNIQPETVDNEVLRKIKEELTISLAQAESDARVARNQLENLMSTREAQAQDIQRRSNRLSSITSGTDYEALQKMSSDIQMQMDSILHSIGFAMISEDEYVLAHDIVDNIEKLVIRFLSCYRNVDLENIFIELQSRNYSLIIPDEDLNKEIYQLSEQLGFLEDKFNKVSRDLEIISILDNRPESCTIDTCYFVKQALEIRSNYPNGIDLDGLRDEIDSIRSLIADKTAQYNGELERQKIENDILRIIDEIRRNRRILAKVGFFMEDGKPETTAYLIICKYSEYAPIIHHIKESLSDPSIVSEYNRLDKQLTDLNLEIKSYEDKMDIIAELDAEISELNKSLNNLSSQIISKNNEVISSDNLANGLRSKLADFAILEASYSQYQSDNEKLIKTEASLVELEEAMSKIKSIRDEMKSIADNIKKISSSLNPLMKQRDNINHSLRMIDEYEQELALLNEQYGIFEIIKKYSSPTTGIQLVFMEIYMGKIISLANELLSFLFNGQFTISPFVINENEFRIPCQGNGYQNDDISSMSSGQISMISMILSFAILFNSSTTYNIIKLDEIDGPLDDTNRGMFLDVLEKIMDIMHTQQCIMISHNAELNIANADVILLGHSGENYTAGNIIWKAY